jgi:hypothetical protein
MQYRGSDDDVVGFGHFCEVHRVKAGPDDVVVPPNGNPVVTRCRIIRMKKVPYPTLLHG